MFSPWSPGHPPQDNKTGFLTLGSSPHCLGGPPAAPKGGRELVKDECQEVVSCQSHRESTDGSTLLVTELVV